MWFVTRREAVETLSRPRGATYDARTDGVLLTCEPATELPMALRYFVF